MNRGTRVVTWNGRDLPAEFRALPAGRYIIEALSDDGLINAEAGLEAALDSSRQGQSDDGARARAIVDAALGRCRSRVPRRPAPPAAPATRRSP